MITDELKKKLEKLPYSKIFMSKIRSAKISSSIELFGNKMFLKKLSFVSWKLSREGIYEETETRYVMDQIKEGQIVLDIGANIGYYTLIFANLVGKKGHVFAFEPEPDNFDLLKKNVETNNYKNTTTENLAVSNKIGNVKLYLCKSNAGQHKIFPSKTISDDYVNVNVTTIDEYFKLSDLYDKISFIKIDVEGAEMGVLQGMDNLLEKNRLTLLMEFNPKQMIEYNVSPQDLLNFLVSKGFILNYVDKENKIIKQVKSISSFLQKLNRTSQAINLICVKN